MPPPADAVPPFNGGHSVCFSVSTLLSADAEAHFTDHSKRPAESPSGNVTSRRSDFVRTGAKFTVEGVPRYVG